MNQIKLILHSSVNRVTRKAQVTCLQHACVANPILAIQCIARDVHFSTDLSSARIKPFIFIISLAFLVFFINFWHYSLIAWQLATTCIVQMHNVTQIWSTFNGSSFPHLFIIKWRFAMWSCTENSYMSETITCRSYFPL